jgi:hypothetical protein
MEPTGLEKLSPSLREPVRQYALWLMEHAGTNGLSLTLFGVACSGAFDPARHTLQNVLVLQQVDLLMLRELAREGGRFGKQRISAPLVMTPAFIKASQDSYPLELIEIQQQHLVLFGDDPFERLDFQPEHVRLQCERELKTISIGMRQGLVAGRGRDHELGPIVSQAIEGLARTLRGLLWLQGKRELRPMADVLAEIEALVGSSLSGIRRAVEHASRAYDWQQFQDLYRDVEALGHYTDAW